MKRLIAFLTPIFMVASCGNNAATGSGRIDCYSIKATSPSSSTSLSKMYSVQYSPVYEYKDEKGAVIYLNSRWNDEWEVRPVHVHKDRYTTSFTLYTFSRLIGYLTLEYNYYLDLASRTLDCEMKWSEYKYDSNPNEDETVDNKEAFGMAKRGYYFDPAYKGTYEQESGRSYYFYDIVLDLDDKGLERHTYVQISEDCNIEYRPKWF